MDHIPRSVVVGNGKGGVGKTSLTLNLAAIAARIGDDVIIVDLDPQASCAVALGIEDHDGGESLLNSLVGTTDPIVHDTGRSGVGYVLIGAQGKLVVDFFTMKGKGNPSVLAEALINAVSRIVPDGALVMIDTPPSAGSLLAEAAMLAAEKLIIPTREDATSIDGLGTTAGRLVELREDGHRLPEISGIVLFGWDPRATKVNEAALAVVTERAHGLPILESYIRNGKKASIEAASAGVTAVEYADAAAVGVKGMSLARNAQDLAQDYVNVFDELGLT